MVKRIIYTFSALASLMLTASVLNSPAMAAGGDAYFILSPAGGTYTVGSTITLSVSEYSTSGDNMDAAQADFSYNDSLLQFENISNTGPFSIVGQQSGGGGSVSIAYASSSAQSGTQAFANITFKVLASGSATINLVSGSNESDIDNNSGGSIWDGAVKSATYTLINPSSGGGSSGGSSSGSGGGSTYNKNGSSTNSTSNSNYGSPASVKAPNLSTPTPTIKNPSIPSSSSTSGGAVNLRPSSITITVTDSKGKPVANAKVVLDDRYSEYTNGSGRAGFSNISGGKYTLTVSASGKNSVEDNVTLTPGANKLVAYKLTNSMPIIPVASAVIIVAVLVVVGYRLIKFKGNGQPSGYMTFPATNTSDKNSSPGNISGAPIDAIPSPPPPTPSSVIGPDSENKHDNDPSG